MAYGVSVKEVAPERFAGVRDTYRIADLSNVMGEAFARVMVALASQGLQPTGGAVTLYHGWTSDTVDAEIAFTIDGDFAPQQGVNPGALPGGRVVFTVHVGPYDQLEAAYEAVQQYAQANDLALADMMWERYLTDREVEPDLNRHVTEVYWPLA